MAADTNLASLRTRLRRLTSAPDNTLTDEDLDSYLEANRSYVYREVLVTPDGKMYRSTGDTFDAGASLSDSAGDAVTPDTADPLGGFWTFTARHSGTVYLSGYTYDVHAAASDVWEYLLGTIADSYSFVLDGESHAANQISTRYAEQRDYHRSLARGSNVEVTRDYR